MRTAAALAPNDSLETDLVSDETTQRIREIGIPPCPAVLVEFMSEANKDEPDFRRLSFLINKDVALSASLLKTINSPFYGSAQKARTVHDALALLGLRQASRLIAGLLLRRAFASFKSPAMSDYWDSSAKIALLSGYLARELRVVTLEEAHTYGLFRDCGVPVLLARYDDCESLLTMTRSESERTRAEIERNRYGFDHTVVGATLAQTWYLSSEMCQTIRLHNAYDQPGFRDKPGTDRCLKLICLGLLAEQLHRVHRGTYNADAWALEDALVNDVLGPVHERLEPLSDDLARILDQS